MAFLSEIERPTSLFMKIAYMVSRKQYGKILSPLKVIYSRSPALLPLTLKIQSVMDKKLSLSHELITLISAHTAFLNGCSFCEDLHLAEAMKRKLGIEKFKTLSKYQESSAFSPAEKAALRFVEEITLQRSSSQPTIDELKKYYSEREIVEIGWMAAIGNYFNLLTKSFGVSSDSLSVSGLN